jgi:hypothetical protein
MMDWKQAAEATYIGGELYRTEVGQTVTWETLDTLKLVSSIQIAVAQLAWAQLNRETVGGTFRPDEVTGAKPLWSRN